VGVFTYSHEEGTRAFALADDVPVRVKKARRNALMRLQKRLVEKRHRSRRGETIRVMVDGPSAESPLVLQSRMEGQAPDIDAVVYLSNCDPSDYRPGQLISARVVGTKGYDLIAAPI
jgi:ribosomal protein S12 methylthiotransferase